MACITFTAGRPCLEEEPATWTRDTWTRDIRLEGGMYPRDDVLRKKSLFKGLKEEEMIMHDKRA